MCRQLDCNWKRPLMSGAECLTMGHQAWSQGVCIVFLLWRLLDGTILALSMRVCLHVRICWENIHLGEQVIPTVHILSFGLSWFAFTLKVILLFTDLLTGLSGQPNNLPTCAWKSLFFAFFLLFIYFFTFYQRLFIFLFYFSPLSVNECG